MRVVKIAAALALAALAAVLSPATGAGTSARSTSSLLSCDTTAGRAFDHMFFGASCTKQHPQSAGGTPAPRQQLQVIMAGFPRCGSSTLKVALERLGYAACHGSELSNYPRMTRAYVRRNVAALVDETERLGFNATLELHGALWEDILALRPQAKVLLLTRDFAGFYKSVLRIAKVYSVFARFPLNYVLRDYDDTTRHFLAYLTGDVDDCAYGLTCAPGSPEHRAWFERAFEHTTARVRAVVPPEQLLVLDLRKGVTFAELCRFLDIAPGACPPEAVPRINSGGEIDAIRRVLELLEILCYTAFVLVCGGLVLLGFCCARRGAGRRAAGRQGAPDVEGQAQVAGRAGREMDKKKKMK